MTLAHAPDSVFRIWSNRLQLEYRAAAVFAQLKKDLEKLYGKRDEIAQLCRQAEEEKLIHAKMCIEIIKYSGQLLEFNYLKKEIQLGPEELPAKQKILYSCVVLLVTETLRIALLTEMSKLAEPGLVRDTIHQILQDEAKHSHVGWAELTRSHQDLSWAQPYVPFLLREVLQNEIQPMLSRQDAKENLSPWGILNPLEANPVIENTIEQVIGPGLERYGLKI